MGHHFPMILSVLLIYMFCKQGGCAENESWTSYNIIASDSAKFHQCKDSNLATFWKNMKPTNQDKLIAPPGFYINLSDLELQDTYETGRQCELNLKKKKKLCSLINRKELLP